MEQITMTEAARILGYRRSNVYALVKRGLLTADRKGPRSMLVNRAEVEALVAAGKPKRGRPRRPGGDADA